MHLSPTQVKYNSLHYRRRAVCDYFVTSVLHRDQFVRNELSLLIVLHRLPTIPDITHTHTSHYHRVIHQYETEKYDANQFGTLTATVASTSTIPSSIYILHVLVLVHVVPRFSTTRFPMSLLFIANTFPHSDSYHYFILLQRFRITLSVIARFMIHSEFSKSVWLQKDL